MVAIVFMILNVMNVECHFFIRNFYIIFACEN